jgi:hypothetical protein
MEDIDEAPASRQDAAGFIKEANSAIDEGDDDLIYDKDCFQKYKPQQRYKAYIDRLMVVEMGVDIADLDVRAPQIRVVLDAQGWTGMVGDHRLAAEELVREFYANIHWRYDKSFQTCVRREGIHVTPTLISTIMGTPQVSDPEYLWPVDHLPTHAELVECFTEGCPRQMETEEEGNF